MYSSAVQRADEGSQRRLQAGAELGEHLLARRHRRQLLHLRRVDRLALEHAALHRRALVVLLGEIGEHLRGGHRILARRRGPSVPSSAAPTRPLSFTARSASVFLITTYSTFALRRRRRRSVIRFTFSPVKSV